VAETKRFRKLREFVEQGTKYPVDEALEMLTKAATANFDESVDLAVRLGVNPRQADQMVRGACSLPYGTGKPVRVLVFAQGDAARAAEEAGADFVGGDEIITKIQKEGWLEFDKAIAVRTMMAKVGRLGRVLGPRGLMPNPKSGSVVAPDPDAVAQAVRETKGGKIDFRVEKAGIIHAPIGKASMGIDKIRDNMYALVATLVRMKPASAKGVYVRSVTLSTTMGPGIRMDPNEVVRLSQTAER
jgi:large subunit ribosomal protein L1